MNAKWKWLLKENKDKEHPYVVKSLSLFSMLLCLMHILVNAEPISFVAPVKKHEINLLKFRTNRLDLAT